MTQLSKHFHFYTANRSQERFINLFQKRNLPTGNIPEFSMSRDYTVDQVLKRIGLVSSISDARRLIKQGGVKIDGIKV